MRVRALVGIGVVLVAVACGGSDDGGGSSGAGSSASSASSGGSSGASSSSSGSSGASGGSSGVVPGTAPVLGGCKIFPDDNPWNQDISKAEVDTAAMAAIAPTLHPSTKLHPDWGTFTDNYGIPITVGAAGAPLPMTWTTSYGKTESDKLPCAAGGGDFCYPIPLTAKIEGGAGAAAKSDRHLLFLDTTGAPGACTLYEIYNAQNPGGSSGWTASNGAIFHLGSNALRPDGWTSADAAGLPVLPGLVRADEALAGDIRHAIRFTMGSSFQGYIHPATHAAGDADPTLPPMGLRLRLKASFDTRALTGPTLAIAAAMKKYGLLLADNGSDWYIGGETSDKWTPDVMDGIVAQMSKITGGDFEIVKSGAVQTNGL
jgi:hypothetical protein